MPQLTLYIDTSKNRLLTALNLAQVLDITSLPIFYPDVLQLQVYLMVPLQTQINPAQPSYAIINTAGLALELEISDGKADNDRTVYASQYAWNTDANNQYFYANLNLNTVPMQTLVKATEPNKANAFLKVAFIGAGGQTDILSQSISIGIGIGNPQLIMPPQLTALAREVADQLYYPIQGKAGVPIYAVSPNGKIIMGQAIDKPDGTAEMDWSPGN